MDSFPEPEVIGVDTPPCSPVLFNDDSFDIPDIHEVVSPMKRARSTKTAPGRKSKRRKNGNLPPSTHAGEVEPVDDFCESHIFDEEVAEGYAGYIDSVKEQVAGFFPVSDDLYVVQGWDEKFSCVKVSLISKNNPIKLTSFLEYMVSLTTCRCWERRTHRVYLSSRPQCLKNSLRSRTIYS